MIDLGPPVVSPAGNAVAFRLEQASVERNTYDTAWYVQDMDGAPPTRVADGGAPLRDSAGISVPATAVWSPDGQWIYFRALIDGRIDVWRAAADGSLAEPVTRDPADVRGFELSSDGATLTYSTGATREEVDAAERDEYDSGIRMDASVPIGQGLFRSGAIEGRLATQRFSDVWFDRIALLDNVPDRWWETDLGTGVRREVPASMPRTPIIRVPGRPIPEQVVRDDRSDRIALLTREPGDRIHPRLSMLPGHGSKRPVDCLADECTGKSITALAWRPRTDELLFTVTGPEMAQSIHAWNVQTGEVTPVVDARGLLNGGRRVSSSCGVSASALVCVAAEADVPPRLERVDLPSGQRRLMFDPNEALAADLAAAVPAQLLRWTDMEGRIFTGQLFSAPAGDVVPPLFVTYYSCTGFLRGGVGDEWPLASLAAGGISALCINAPPHHSDPFVRYDEGRTAVESIVSLLASEGYIDPGRVGMGGLSFGTAVTLWVAINSEVLAAASVTSPVVSPNYYLLSSMKGQPFFDGLREVWGLGAPQETPEQWRALSPFFGLDRMDIPTLFQMPEQEYMHALDYMIPLLREDRADLYVFPHEPHQKFQPRHKQAAFDRNVDWFRFWLQGVEDSNPAKQSQYRHWRTIKAALESRR